MEGEIEEQKELIFLKKHSRTKKILIIIAKILLLFIMPILVAILDHFIF